MSRKFWIYLVITMLLVLGLALSACQPEATETPQEEPAVQEAPTEAGVPVAEEEPTEAEAPVAEEETSAEPSRLSIAIATNIDSFDPHLTSSFAVANVVDYMVETLVKADVNGDIVPGLAKTWEASEDGLVYTLHLQEGVSFSDGTPFNAEAVKYNIERFLDEQLQNTKNPYNKIINVEAVDETTVKFYLEKPSSEILPALSNTNIGMISPASVPKDTETYLTIGTTAPIGTGPYVLKEYVTDSRVVVERNLAYWGVAPYYDEIEFQIVPEAATRESLLLSGQVDLAVLPPITDLPALDANPDVVVIRGNTARIIFIGLNTQSEYLSDVRVRQALNYAIDKEAIVNNILLGNAVPVVSPMPESFFGFCQTEPQYTYDPDKARELLADAGVPAEFTLKFIAPTGRYAQDFQVAEAISGFLAEVGITAIPETADWATYMSWVLVGPEEADRDMYVLGWAGGYPHGSHTMSILTADTFFNRGYYNNPEVDALAAAADSAITTEDSADLYCQANQIIWDDAPWIFLYQQGYPVIHSSQITGITVLPSEKFDTSAAMPVQ